MAFDAGMLAASVHEIKALAVPGRVEKVLQPTRDEIVLLVHGEKKNIRLSISASTNTPRINITDEVKENPATPPMFCMLLRKHLTGAKLTDICQLSFERAAMLTFDSRDELGYRCEKHIIAETMGKYSNIILLGADKKIISALRIIDFSASLKRQIIPGMTYELPPSGGRLNPLTVSEDEFASLFSSASSDGKADKFIVSSFMGISPLISREIVFRTTKSTDSLISECDIKKLWFNFNAIFKKVAEGSFKPVLITTRDKKMLEFSYTDILQYSLSGITTELESFGKLFETFYGEKERSERIHQRAGDVLRLITNAEARLTKKIAAQKAELADCDGKERFKVWADLITSNIYALSKGDREACLLNYYDDPPSEITVKLDERLTPAQNAQRYYKKYNKAKTAESVLKTQIELAEKELEYIYTVFDSLTKCETEADITEVRSELYHSGYASKMKNYSEHKQKPSKPLEFTSSSGYRILCGKNNVQNDHLTTKLASKLDYWFHVKNAPGSHVVLMCNGEEPDAKDFTEAANIAACYSKLSDGEGVAVDYTLIKNVKKPSGSKPGYVIYSTNYTAYVTPDREAADALRG